MVFLDEMSLAYNSCSTMFFSVASTFGDLNCILSHHTFMSSVGILWSPKNGITEGNQNEEDQVDITITTMNRVREMKYVLFLMKRMKRVVEVDTLWRSLLK